ncbi:MAG: hypothetical protein HN578_12205 [Rhodospirillales bacterium]|nr:hypothetical protein [Rhodospirillales bacterium]
MTLNFDDIFRADSLRDIFYTQIFPKKILGVDRITVSNFEKNLDGHLDVVVRKCLAGTYQFTPYLLSLMAKGPGKIPREISIPCVRDRLVLKALTNFLHEVFSDCVSKDLPNTVIKKIKASLNEQPEETGFIQLDFRNFYGSIPQDQLLSKIQLRITDDAVISLIRRAIKNPTLPANYKKEERKNKSKIGVSQGLAVSNILAEIYLQSFDQSVAENCLIYRRFVDDVFILCKKDRASEVWEKIIAEDKASNLELNKEKSSTEGVCISLDQGFDFLGYSFKSADLISVRESSYNRFIHSLIGRITRFRHELTSKIDKDVISQIFIDELNERITGALDENKRYGWVFFFCEITDEELLNRIDRVLRKNLDRIPGFDQSKIKRVVRARYEALHSPRRGYIRDYNAFTLEDKIAFLNLRDILKVDGQYTEDQIDKIFNDVKQKNLSKLEADTAKIS